MEDQNNFQNLTAQQKMDTLLNAAKSNWQSVFTDSSQLEAILYIYSVLIDIKLAMDSGDELSFRNSISIESILQLLLKKEILTLEELEDMMQQETSKAVEQIKQAIEQNIQEPSSDSEVD